ncbi:hypothetical protein J7M00_03265 [bacterium]|nr:hypothetical protein [bacterium]
MENIMFQMIWLPGAAGLLCLILMKIKGAEGFLDFIRKLVTFVVSGYILYIAFRLFLNPKGYILAGTISFGDLSTRIILRATPLASLMILFSSLFAFLTSIFSMKYRSGSDHNNWYYSLVLWTLAAANTVFLAGDFFTLLVSWELSTIFLFGLIALGDNEKTPLAAAKTLVILGFTEAAMLFAMLYIWITQGTLVFADLSIPLTSTVNIVLYFLIASAALAKAGAMPFHSWVPTASEGAPTSIMAYLPASMDKLMGIYFLFFVSYNLFVISPAIKLTLMIIGVITIILAVFMAMIQHEWRRLLSYHAVSQVGYMVLGIGTGTAIGILGGMFHMLNNAIYKNSLFACAAAVEKQTGITDLEKLGGLGRRMPVLFFTNIISAFAIAGIIPLNGFISKWLIYRSCLDAGQPIMFILAIFGSGLTLASFIKVLHSVYMGPLPPELQNVKSPGFSLVFPPLVLSLLCIIFGILPIIPLGKLLVPTLSSSISSIMATLPSGYEFDVFSIKLGSSYWNVGLAVLLMFLGVVIAWLYYAMGKAFKTRKARAFVGGIKPGTLAGYHTFTNEAMRVPGTGFYNTIAELPIFRSILPSAKEGLFDPYEYLNRIGNAIFVNPLKLLHNGILSSYLSWAIIGLVVVFIVLIQGYF